MITRPKEFNHTIACFALNEMSLMAMIQFVHALPHEAEGKKAALLHHMTQYAAQMKKQNFNVTTVVVDVQEDMFAHTYTVGATMNPVGEEMHKAELEVKVSKTGKETERKITVNEMYIEGAEPVAAPKLILP